MKKQSKFTQTWTLNGIVEIKAALTLHVTFSSMAGPLVITYNVMKVLYFAGSLNLVEVRTFGNLSVALYCQIVVH